MKPLMHTSAVRRRRVALVALACATAVGLVGCQAAGQASPPGSDDAAPTTPGDGDGVIDEADGLLPEGVTVFDEDQPGVTNLNPALLDALRQAGTASSDRATIMITSGWRSAEYQAQLLTDAIDEYGSREEAARWVASPETSAHVSGDAVDIGPYDAIDWLVRFGADYGLCQIYGNESWHFELRSEAAENGCPPMYDDPTQDPRLQT